VVKVENQGIHILDFFCPLLFLACLFSRFPAALPNSVSKCQWWHGDKGKRQVYVLRIYGNVIESVDKTIK